MGASSEHQIEVDSPSTDIMYITNLQDKFKGLQEDCRAQEVKKKSKSKQQHDFKARERSFLPGDLVLLIASPKGPRIHAALDGMR